MASGKAGGAGRLALSAGRSVGGERLTLALLRLIQSAVRPARSALLLLVWPCVVHADAIKTLTRFHDPVVVRADALPGAARKSTTELALYRVHDGRLEHMPYQFDACDRRGEVEVDAPQAFTLDDNDEIVFMAKDTGDRAGVELLGAGGVEIEVEDPHGGEGWAYLLPASTAADPGVTAPYVYFDLDRRRAGSALYSVEYAEGRNFLTGLQVKPEAGGNGADLVRQTRMLGEPTFSLLFGDVTLSFTERNSIVRVDGVRNGPVRSVRRVRLSVELGSLFPDLPNGTVYTFHYFSSFTTPTRMSVPWLALHALRDFRFENVLEFADGAAPREYWDAANPAGTRLNAPGEEVASGGDHEWWAVQGESGSILQAFLVPQEWTDWGITRGTVVHRANAASASPEAATGAGFTLRDMIRLRRSGAYDLMQSTVVLPGGYRAGDAEQVMAMFHAPLRVQTHAVSPVPAFAASSDAALNPQP